MCKKCNAEKTRLWRKNNKDKVKAYKATEKYKKYCRDRQRQRREKDDLYRLKWNIKRRVGNSFRRKNISKENGTIDIIGCDYDTMISWLEYASNCTFDDNTHIDHVVPISLAETEEELVVLNHFSNLQLLPKDKNMDKSNNYILENNLNRVLDCNPNFHIVHKIIERCNIDIIDQHGQTKP